MPWTVARPGGMEGGHAGDSLPSLVDEQGVQGSDRDDAVRSGREVGTACGSGADTWTTADHVSGPIMWANMHLLFWLSLVPFSTSWLGESHGAAAPAALYGLIC